MLDNLGRETGPQKAISQAWLNHSLQRGDIARFLEPILLILLHPDSARVSVQHVNVHRPRKVVVTDHSSKDQREDVEAKVYAISSISGNIIYHISDESRPSSVQVTPEKKILALTSVVNVDSGKGPTVVTSNSMLQEFELPSSHERGLKLPISLFVNPFGSLSSLGSDSQLDYTTFSPPDLSPKAAQYLGILQIFINTTEFRKHTISFNQFYTGSYEHSRGKYHRERGL